MRRWGFSSQAQLGDPWSVVAVQVVVPVLSVIVPVAIIIASGYVLGRIRNGDMAGLNEAAFHVFVPALVYRTAASSALPASAIFSVAAAATAISLACGLAASVWFQRRGVPHRGLTLASMIPNNANMGMSLCGLAFGDEGLALATTYYATTALLCFTAGLYLMASEGSGFQEMLRVPVLYALLAGIAVHQLGLTPPAMLDLGVELLGQAAIPAMLLSLGHRLARTPLRSLRLAFEAATIRIGCGLVLSLALTHILPLSPVAQRVVIVQGVMPAAVMTTVLAERYKREPEWVASTVAVSTLVSVALLPFVLSRMM